MSVSVIKLWTVHRENDDRSDGPITEIVNTEALANRVAAGTGWYGGNAGVRERWAIETPQGTYMLAEETHDPITVATTMTEVAAANDAKDKAAALAKLSPRDRALLGL